MSDFSIVHNRRNTNSLKWDSIEKTYGEKGLLPLWVADMDFKTSPAILEALKKIVDQGILGYMPAPDSLYRAIQSWQQRRYNYFVPKESILFNSGVVPSIACAVQAYTKPGDAILVHDPVYPPFTNVVKQNNRIVIRSSLIIENNHFVMNIAEMEKQIVDENIRLFILCNPQNPGGRVWTKTELEEIGKLCAKYNVIVVSDEIHQDIIFEPNIFTTFNNAHPTFKDFSIILTSATKTFNLAGIKNSMVFIENLQLREKFVAIQQKNQQQEINSFGFVGTEAAYNYGEKWLNNLLSYLQENIVLVSDFFKKNLPQVIVMQPEGTYLIWLDFSALNLTDASLQKKLVHKGKVVLNAGISFGPEGSNYMRLNIACPKETLLDGLHRIKKAFDS